MAVQGNHGLLGNMVLGEFTSSISSIGILRSNIPSRGRISAWDSELVMKVGKATGIAFGKLDIFMDDALFLNCCKIQWRFGAFSAVRSSGPENHCSLGSLLAGVLSQFLRKTHRRCKNQRVEISLASSATGSPPGSGHTHC